MNLTTDPWIPVLMADGSHANVSLIDAFSRGCEIADLSVRPHERIALLRLLICVAQAALDGPKDEDEWRECLNDIPERTAEYLRARCLVFELFGTGPRFLQVSNLSSIKADGEDGNAVDKLDVTLSCGANTTLFDNAGGSNRSFTPAQLALMLLTFQSFAAGGTTSYVKWNGSLTRRSASASVCIASSPLHAFLRKATLLETLHANLLNKEAFGEHAGRGAIWGEPIWHRMPGKLGDVPETTRSYLGRLVPVTRAVWLNETDSTVVLGEALIYPAFDEIFADPFTTVISKKNERSILRADPSRAIWRQLASVATLRRSDGLGGPIALRNALSSDTFDLCACGLATHPIRIASIVDSVESVYRVPRALTEEIGQKIYNDAIGFAETTATRLFRATAKYRRVLNDEIERGEGRKRGLNLRGKAAIHFWTAAETLVSELFRLVTNPPSVRKARYQFSETDWGKALFSAALEAYDFACPHATPRQLQAYVLGRAIFFRTTDTNETSIDQIEEKTA